MSSANLLKIFQWNCHSLIPKKGSLSRIAADYDILLLCETWLKPNINFYLPNFNIIRKDRDDRQGGGLLTAIRNDIPFKRVDTTFDIGNCLDTLAISIPTDLGHLLVVNVYRNPRTPPGTINWPNFLQSAADFPCSIVCGDLNSHHQSWGCHMACTSGLALYDAILDSDFIIINKGDPTLFSRPGQNKSAIDLTMVSKNLKLISNWQVLPDKMGSDHFPISVEIGVPFTFYNFYSHKYNLKSVNWKIFKSHLLSIHTDTNLPSSTDSTGSVNSYSSFLHDIDEALHKADPKLDRVPSRRKVYASSPPWWNGECKKIVRVRLAKLKKYLHSSTYENFLDYQKWEAKATKRLKSIKSANFRSFCESLSVNSPISTVWAKVRSFRHRLLCPPSPTTCPVDLETIKYMNSYIQDFIKMSNDFSNIEIPPLPVSFTDANYTNTPSSSSTLATEPAQEDHIFSPPFNLKELLTVLKNSKTDSSPGLDRISFLVIQNLPETSLTRLLHIFNNIFETGAFPSSWRNFLVFLLPKSTLRKFRPIALASCFLKLMEKLVQQRLYFWTENKGLLSPFQYGFRRGRSCADNLAILSSKLHLATSSSMISACLFLDIAAAYDNVIPNILIWDLINLGLPWKVCKFIFNLTTVRYVYFRINGENKGPHIFRRGLPQGCVLSPLLYNIYTKNIHKLLHPHCDILEYADDLVLYASSNDGDNCIAILQESANNVNTFLKKRGLSISPSKSKLVFFPTPTNQLPESLSLRIDNQVVSRSNNVKFLGVILQSSLSWELHLTKLIDHGSKILNLLKCLAGTWWGSHPRILQILYQALCRSSFEYGCHALSICKNSKLYTKLTKLHNKILRVIMGYRISTPIIVMQSELGEFPIIDRFQLISDKFLIKTFQSACHPIFPILNRLTNILRYSKPKFNQIKNFLLLKSYQKFGGYKPRVLNSATPLQFLLPYPSMFFEPSVDLSIGISIDNSPNPESVFNSFISIHYANYTHFYTDGSKKTDSPVGFAIYAPFLDLEMQFRVSEHASIFTAETMAICESIQYIIEKDISFSVIFSDAKSVLQASLSLATLSSSSFLLLKLRNLLYVAHCSGLTIDLVWLPGHRGIPGNETADNLARLASSEGLLTQTKLPHTDIWALSLQGHFSHVEAQWKQVSRVERKGLYYFSTFFDPSHHSRPWYAKSKANRKFIVTISRLRANHYNLAASLARKNLSDSATCAHCGDENQDINHIVWACPNFSQPRSLLENRLRRLKFFPPYCIESFLSNPNGRGIHLIFQFLNSTNLCI